MTGGTQKKRVLFIVPAFTKGTGGAERVITTVLRYLDRTDLECHLATIQSGAEFLKDVPQDVVIHKLDVSRIRYALAPVIGLIRRIRPNTVLCTVGYANVLLLLARPFLPPGTRLIIREATTPSAFLEHEAANRTLWNFFYRRMYAHADQIICLTDAMKQEFRDRFFIPTEKLVRIYNPVDHLLVRDSARSGGNPYTSNGPNIVAAGRLRPEKGFDVLMNAFSLVRKHVKEVQLTILGEGPGEPGLRQQAFALGLDSGTHFPGFQQNPWCYFAHADLFVLPSRLEGMPNALLEALALDTPVVATNCVEAIRELQSLDDRIITTPPDNPAALAETIISVLKHRGSSRPSHANGLNKSSFFDPVEIASHYKSLF